VNLPIARPAVVLLAITAMATVGCGADGRTAGEAGTAGAAAAARPAHDAERIEDLVPLTTAQAADRATGIALVVARGSRVVEGAPGTPFTRTTFAALDVLKGRLPRAFVIQVVGGRLGNTIVTSPVQPFVRGHRYVLFLGPDGPAGPTIFPQAVVDDGPRLPAALRAIRDRLRTTGAAP